LFLSRNNLRLKTINQTENKRVNKTSMAPLKAKLEKLNSLEKDLQ
jgi:hypothetical protein